MNRQLTSKKTTAAMPAAGPADPGLQPERTALAWQRMGLALMGLALLIARSQPRVERPVALFLAICVGVSGVLLLSLARPRFDAADRNLRAWHRGESYAAADMRALDGRLPLVAVVGSLLLAVLAGLMFIG